jgi:hypothetical protein
MNWGFAWLWERSGKLLIPRDEASVWTLAVGLTVGS